MQNADSLRGKEYIDFLLRFLQGEESAKKKPKLCQHELTSEEATKLLKTLKEDNDLLLYFTRKDGFKILVDSLEFNHECLILIQELVSTNEKQVEFF